MASKSRICSLDRLAVGKNTLCMNAYYAAVWLEAPSVFYPCSTGNRGLKSHGLYYSGAATCGQRGVEV